MTPHEKVAHLNGRHGEREKVKKNRNRAAMASVISTIAMLVVNTAWTDTITGKVVAVADGDTLTVLNGREELKVRLNAIDAPKKKQPFGTESKQAVRPVLWSTSNH